MKRLFLILFAIGMTAMSSMSMAGMSNSRIRQETRFLTDKMAYELSMNTAQYNDAYEINYDFIYSIRNLMDDVVHGYEWALNDYYQTLDVRNDDLRWVLSEGQYRRFLGADYFYRPIYASGGRWNFRVYITYTNRNQFYFGRPYHYRSYCGGHYRTHYESASYYRGRYNHAHYRGSNSARSEKVYHNNRRSDFGSVNIRPNTSSRPTTPSRRPASSDRRENAKSTKPETPRRENNRGENSRSERNRGESSRQESKRGESNRSESNRRESSRSEVRRESVSGSSSRTSGNSSRRSTPSSSRSEK